MENKTKIPIVICTKGRYTTGFNEKQNKRTYISSNLGKLYEQHLNAIEEGGELVLNRTYLIVEPQEASLYQENYPEWPIENIIVLGDNNQGLAYARQAAMIFAQNNQWEMMLMLDDDANLTRVEWNETKGKMSVERCDITDWVDSLIEWWNKFDDETKELTGVLGPEYQQFGWSKVPQLQRDPDHSKTEYSKWTSADCAVIWFPMKYKEHGIVYDNLPLKCDRDFTAQVSASGLYTMKVFRWQMDSPLNGKMVGGCQSWYKTEGQEAKECHDLILKWNWGTEWVSMEESNNDFVRALVKEKKTSYGRSTDIRYLWNRIFRWNKNGVKNRAAIKELPQNIAGFNDSITNICSLSSLTEKT